MFLHDARIDLVLLEEVEDRRDDDLILEAEDVVQRLRHPLLHDI